MLFSGVLLASVLGVFSPAFASSAPVNGSSDSSIACSFSLDQYGQVTPMERNPPRREVFAKIVNGDVYVFDSARGASVVTMLTVLRPSDPRRTTGRTLYHLSQNHRVPEAPSRIRAPFHLAGWSPDGKYLVAYRVDFTRPTRETPVAARLSHGDPDGIGSEMIDDWTWHPWEVFFIDWEQSVVAKVIRSRYIQTFYGNFYFSMFQRYTGSVWLNDGRVLVGAINDLRGYIEPVLWDRKTGQGTVIADAKIAEEQGLHGRKLSSSNGKPVSLITDVSSYSGIPHSTITVDAKEVGY